MATTGTGYACYMRVRVKPDKRLEFLQLMHDLVANVRMNEPETLVYEVLQGSDENEFVFFECFTDEAAQQRHQQMPYHVAVSPAGYACLAEDPHIEFLKPAI
ncbi:MAG TPA: putative quinol monooxygenase [Steroidobacteraceae bacterium]|nr:putative quinol monooxygenase [Steroidobacteraceae bacterium]